MHMPASTSMNPDPAKWTEEHMLAAVRKLEAVQGAESDASEAFGTLFWNRLRPLRSEKTS